MSVPDVAAAEQLAAAVLDYGEYGSPRQAAERLDAHGRRRSPRSLPPQATAPEHARAVDALRARDPVGYAEAIDELVGAHLAQRDEQRTADLLAGLGSDSLARAWTPTDDGPPVRFGPGLVHADRAAARRAAPAGPGGRRGGARRRPASGWTVRCSAPPPRGCWPWPPRGPGAGGTTLLSLLYRASALVIRGRSPETPGRVVALTPGARSVPVPRGQVEQAGA